MSKGFDILIVEDEPVVSGAARKTLRAEGYEVEEVEDAPTALQRLEQNRYKLILCDLMLPNFSGFKLLEVLRADFPRLPVVIITGYATLENAIAAFKDGAFDFIPKPFDVDELLGVVYRGLRYSETEHRPALSVDPNSHYRLGEHAVVRLDRDGSAIIMVGNSFPGLMGEIEKIELPTEDTEILQGNACVRIIARGPVVHKVWAPLSGRVLKVNHDVENDSDLINRDPYGQGWLVRLLPTNQEDEFQNLLEVAPN